MLIKDNAARAARHQEKIGTVLRYLTREIYSDFSTINRLFGFKNHRGLYDLLNKLVAENVLKKHRAGKLSLWSITALGVAHCGTETRFRGDNLSAVTTPHIVQRLAEQNARLSCEAGGGKNWLYASDPLYLCHAKPTAVFTHPSGERMAVEVETRVKTQARYREIVTKHLLARKQKEWFTVLFVVNSEQHKMAVRMLMKSITYINIDKTRYDIKPEHLSIFRFMTQEGLREQGMTNPCVQPRDNGERFR